MEIDKLSLPGAFVITPRRFGDDRGFFSEVFKKEVFDTVAPGIQFIQDNHSLSREIGVLRGMHFQTPPFAQGKLVRVASGRVLDVVVDIRKGSPTYGKHEAVELSSDNWKQLWVPPGFAHSFLTLEEDTAFLYKVTAPYAPDNDAGIRFDDVDLGIDWPLPANKIITSTKDADLPKLSELDNPFVFGKNC